MSGAGDLYAIGLGSNRRHGRHGAPERVVDAALAALAGSGVDVRARSRIFRTPPIGPAGRTFANAAALIETPLDPLSLLGALKRIERAFGRRPGLRWGARVLDLDILLWSGGAWRSRALEVPHRALAARRFVLDPLVRIAPRWALPSGVTVRQLHARLTRPTPLHRGVRTVGL